MLVIFVTQAYYPRMLSTAINRLRVISIIEAISYLLLLGVAMPLKKILGEPMIVTYAGWTHGGLFILFCAALLNAMLTQKWSIKPPFLIFLASLMPFAPIWVEKWLKKQTPASAA